MIIWSDLHQIDPCWNHFSYQTMINGHRCVMTFFIFGIACQIECDTTTSMQKWSAEIIGKSKTAWWRHQMETFFALLAICTPAPTPLANTHIQYRLMLFFYDSRIMIFYICQIPSTSSYATQSAQTWMVLLEATYNLKLLWSTTHICGGAFQHAQCKCCPGLLIERKWGSDIFHWLDACNSS